LAPGKPQIAAMGKERIVIDPAVCGGRPIVAGTRMRVSDVLDALAAGAGVEELVADFPYLTREDVLACLAYGARAVDHSVVQAA
jgi:uncharacterized protein (DUF433 family)